MGSERPGALRVTSYQVCRGGSFAHARAEADGPGFALAWTADGLAVRPRSEKADEKEGEPGALVTVPWQHVTGVWTYLRSQKLVGYLLEVTFETSHASCPLDFFRVTAAMDDEAGAFLRFLQESHAGRIKDGRAPPFATGRWAAGLYGAGASVRCLRLWLGRASMFFEVLYSICFFLQLHELLLKKEARLISALATLWEELSEVYTNFAVNFAMETSGFEALSLLWRLTYGMPLLVLQTAWRVAFHTSDWAVLILLLQHLFMAVASLDAMCRTLRAAIKSAMTFHKAATKVTRAVKKSTSTLQS